jgi:hypothetical protein
MWRTVIPNDTNIQMYRFGSLVKVSSPIGIVDTFSLRRMVTPADLVGDPETLFGRRAEEGLVMHSAKIETRIRGRR